MPKVTVITRLRLKEISLVHLPAEENSMIAFYKSKLPTDQETDSMTPEQIAALSASLAASEAETARLTGVIKGLEADVALYKGKVDRARAGGAVDDPYEGLPAAQIEALKAADVRTATLEKELAKMRASAGDAELKVEIAKSYSGLAPKPDALLPLIKAAQAIADETERDAALALLKGASDAITAIENGVGLGERLDEAYRTATAEIAELAKARSASTNETFELAKANVMRAHPQLAAKAYAELSRIN